MHMMIILYYGIYQATTILPYETTATAFMSEKPWLRPKRFTVSDESRCEQQLITENERRRTSSLWHYKDYGAEKVALVM